MTIREIKKVICVLYLFGFLTGILYVNVLAKPVIISEGIFSNYFLEEYSYNKIDIGSYIWYIAKLRILPIIFLVIPANMLYRKVFSVVFLVWTGFSCGLIFTTAIMRLGIKGIGLCIVGVLPQFVCYILIYIMLLMYIFTYPTIRWNATKTVSMILFLVFGIITEVYMNPVLMDIYIDFI